MSLVTVPCCVCSGTRFDSVYSGTVPADAPDPAAFFSSSRSRAGYLSIVRCSGCGLMMTNPRDDDATLAEVYTALQDRAYDRELYNRRRTAEEHLALVTRFQPDRTRMLSVGCATGAFVSVAYDAGWRATGLDASAWAVARARERCPGATFVTGLVEESTFPREIFDVVTLWDVLEHVSSPAETLASIRDWLSPRGWLFIKVPNAESAMARLMGKRWVLLLREHLWYFSPRTVDLLLREVGFGVVATKPGFVRFSLANLFDRLSQYPGRSGRVAGLLSKARMLQRWSLRFPIGEMIVVARRTD